MEYRRFGRTNLQLSVFSLGTMRCLASPQIALTTIEKAIALGINHLETARGYGKSEEYLGLYLASEKSVPRENIHITTKLPPTADSSQMARWIDESLTRLQTDYLDCLAIHGLNTIQHLNWITDDRGCLSAIAKAQQQGKIKHLGFSSHGSLEFILEAIQTDLFAFVNLHYYYFWQRNRAVVALAKSKDMGVFIISPSDKGGKLYNPPETLAQLCQPLTPVEFNYQWLLRDRGIHTLSMGASCADELEAGLQDWETRGLGDNDNKTVGAKGIRPNKQHGTRPVISPQTLKTIDHKLQQHLTNTLKSDRCNQCYKCLPCPETINIPEVLRLRNLAVGYDMTNFGEYRYQMFERAGHWFPGKKGDRCTECGDCLPRCPENLDIPKLLKDTHKRLNGSPRRRLWEE